MIQIKSYGVQHKILNYDLLSTYINSFWGDVFEVITKNPSSHYLMILCKVAF